MPKENGQPINCKYEDLGIIMRIYVPDIVGASYGKGCVYEQKKYIDDTEMGQVSIGFQIGASGASSLYGNDSGWEDAMAGMDPKINLETYSMFNERTSYTFEAVTTSQGMVSRVEGKGSAYLGSYYDADSNALISTK